MKIFGGLAVLVLVALAFYAPLISHAPTAHYSLSTIHSSLSVDRPPITTQIHFSGIYNRVSMDYEGYGVYINRRQGQFHDMDRFYGNIHVHGFFYSDWDFDPMRNVGGVWSNTDWFTVERSYSGDEASFMMPKNIPAGLYAIRATAFRQDIITGGRVPVYFQEQDSDWGEDIAIRPLVIYYLILYAEDLGYISMIDQHRSNYFNVHQSNERNLTVQVRANGGAMDRDLLFGELSDHMVLADNGTDIFIMGNLALRADISLANTRTPMTMELFMNGRQIHDHNFFPLGVTRVAGDRLHITIPPGTPQAMYTIRLTHPANEDIFGVFIVETRTRTGFGVPLRGVSRVLLVMGTILAVAAAILFGAPKFIARAQARKFDEISRNRYIDAYGSPAGAEPEQKKAPTHKKPGFFEILFSSPEKLREKEAARLAKIEEEKPKPVPMQKEGDGFLDRMRAAQQRREDRRQSGMTEEQYKEIEAREQRIQEARKISFANLRGTEKDDVELPEEPQPNVIVRDGVEYQVLESVERAAATGAEEEFVQSVVQANLQPSGGGSSILSALRKYTAGEPVAPQTDDDKPEE